MTSSRTAIIAGNWKMNLGPKDAATFIKEILPDLSHIIWNNANITCIVCPPSISLSTVRAAIDSMSPISSVELGAQNMYFEEKGAFTGEISPLMVRELCSSVILGHSERRKYFGETNELVNKKVLAALQYNLQPIVCVGENSEQHEAGQVEQVIHTQIQSSLANIPTEHTHKIVVAYEPIWAIGTGKSATGQGAGNIAAFIRQLYCNMYGDALGQDIHILYGGSVTSENCYEFLSHPEIDGALVGGASIKSDFVEIVRRATGH